MKNDDLKDFFDEDAYNELLNIYEKEETRKKEQKLAAAARANAASRPIRKEPTNQTRERAASPKPPVQRPAPKDVPKAPAQPVHSRAPQKTDGGFHLEIQDLDAEFNEPMPKKTTAEEKRNQMRETLKAARTRKKAEQEEELTDDATIVKRNEPETAGEKFKMFLYKNRNVFALVLVCIVAAVGISTYAISCLNDIFAVNRDSETAIEVNIPPETDTKGVLKILKDNDLIKHRHFCNLISHIDKFKKDNYVPGVYYLTPSMGFERMLLTIKQPVNRGETVTLTFPEGYNIDQIIAKLEEKGVCSAISMKQTLKTVDFSEEFSFIKELDNPEDRYHLLEGYIYPDTYEFYVNENPSSIIRKFLNNFKNKWTEEYAAQAKKLGMSVDDVITLASIIQKEAHMADTKQAPLVSSVLHNRLDKSALYPSLQCDSTEAYIRDYIAKNVDSPAAVSRYTDKYSSYKCAGLPVGAICNPGDDAIRAALFPENTNYYFFAHDVNKKIYMARTDAERRSNNIKILKANNEAEAEKNKK